MVEYLKEYIYCYFKVLLYCLYFYFSLINISIFSKEKFLWPNFWRYVKKKISNLYQNIWQLCKIWPYNCLVSSVLACFMLGTYIIRIVLHLGISASAWFVHLFFNFFDFLLDVIDTSSLIFPTFRLLDSLSYSFLINVFLFPL